MNLAEIRQWLIDVSGRTDLLKKDFSGKPGADKYIKAGSQYLDGKYETPRDKGIIELDLAIGDFSVDVDNFRAIKDVWINGGSKPVYLRKLSLEGLHGLLEDTGELASVSRGVPNSYAVGVPTVDEADPTTLSEKRILLFPPTDAVRKLYVYGLLWSTALEEDENVNFWSTVMPHTLVEAAWMMIERAYRNQEGVRDHRAAIEEDIQQVDFDVVEQDIAQQYQMRNSW